MLSWFGRSLSNRVAVIFALVMGVALAATVTWSAITQSDTLVRETKRGFHMVSALIANNIVQAVKFGAGDKVTDAYAAFAGAEDGNIADILVLRSDDAEPLNQFRNDAVPAADIAAAIAEAPADIKVGVPYELTTADHVIYVFAIGNEEHRFGTMAIAWSTATANAAVKDAVIGLIVIGLIGIVVAVAVASYAVRRIAGRPIGGLTAVMERLAQGDTSVSAPHVSRRDEVGRMAHTVEVFRDNAIRVAELDTEKKRRDEEAAAQRRADMATVAENLEQGVGEIVTILQSAVTELSATAHVMSDVAKDSSSRADEVVHAVQAASSEVGEMEDASGELITAVGAVERQLSESRSISAEADTLSGADQVRVAADELSQHGSSLNDQVREIVEKLRTA